MSVCNEDFIDELKKNNTLLRANIELLTKCNWKCKHCYIPEHNKFGMDIKVIEDMLKQLREIGTFEILFTGGEIFCRSDILNIIKLARSMKFNVILFSNISLLNENLIRELSKLYISSISCTIFSLDENIHDSITKTLGSLKKTLKNIMLIKKYNIPIEIKTILMKPNYKSHIELKEFCEKNNIAYLPTTIVTPKTNGDNSPIKLRLNKDELIEIFSHIESKEDIYLRTKPLNNYICERIRYSIFIDCNGNIYPCDTFKYPVGNIYEDTIKDIWYNSKKLNKIKEMKWKDLKECFNCEINEYCMRCPGIALLENNSILAKSNFACKTAKARFENIQNCKLT